MIKTILLAYDGSASSAKAFDFAADLATRYGAELYVLSVAQTPEFGDEVETEASIEYSRKHHKKLMRDLETRSKRLGIRAQMETAVGHPVRQIIECASQRSADLIVLGHRANDALERWRVGSVAHRVVSYATCSVLLVQ